MLFKGSDGQFSLGICYSLRDLVLEPLLRLQSSMENNSYSFIPAVTNSFDYSKMGGHHIDLLLCLGLNRPDLGAILSSSPCLIPQNGQMALVKTYGANHGVTRDVKSKRKNSGTSSFHVGKENRKTLSKIISRRINGSHNKPSPSIGLLSKGGSLQCPQSKSPSVGALPLLNCGTETLFRDARKKKNWGFDPQNGRVQLSQTAIESLLKCSSHMPVLHSRYSALMLYVPDSVMGVNTGTVQARCGYASEEDKLVSEFGLLEIRFQSYLKFLLSLRLNNNGKVNLSKSELYARGWLLAGISSL
ncbi:hypothetical protein Scep_024247 [Stephania cephalantha]|uniref:Uncharacterized protein n=1 Tax=Stephania cephalantha TaxID=152367 RepID=A0AAP0F1M9_9MAGN